MFFPSKAMPVGAAAGFSEIFRKKSVASLLKFA
jgi:hypothetical protein